MLEDARREAVVEVAGCGEGLLPPIQLRFAGMGFATEPQVVRSKLARDSPPIGSFAQDTSSTAARGRARRVAGRRKIPVALDDDHVATSQRRRGTGSVTHCVRPGEASSDRRVQVARAASEPVLRCRATQEDELEEGTGGSAPELVQRHDRGRKVVGAMREAMEEVTKLDKQLGRETQFLQRERARSQRSRGVVLELRDRQWNSDTHLAVEKPPAADETRQREEQARAQRREAVARLALSAELQTNGGHPNTYVPRTSVPMELLFSANLQTSQDTLDKAWLNKGKEEKHARLAAKLLPNANAERAANRRQGNAVVGARGRAGPRVETRGRTRAREAGPRFPGDRGLVSAVVRN